MSVQNGITYLKYFASQNISKRLRAGEKKMDRYYCVYSRKVAKELQKRGFKLEKIGVNYKAPAYDCYIFKNTKDFQESLNEIVDFLKKS